MALPNDENVAPDPLQLLGVRDDLNVKAGTLATLTDLYDPATYTADVLAGNKTEWTGDVKNAYMDLVNFALQAKNKPAATPADKAALQGIITTAKTDFAKFLSDFSSKCLVSAAAVSIEGGDNTCS